MTDALRAAFFDRLTVDSPHRDRRRRDYNQAIFDAREGWAVFTGTDLDMVMGAFDLAVCDVSQGVVLSTSPPSPSATTPDEPADSLPDAKGHPKP